MMKVKRELMTDLIVALVLNDWTKHEQPKYSSLQSQFG